MELAKLSIPTFRASSVPKKAPPAINKIRWENRAKRSPKQTFPAGSELGSTWVASLFPPASVPRLTNATYLYGKRINYNKNAIIKRRKEAYELAKAQEGNTNKKFIKRDNLHSLADKWSRKRTKRK